MRISDWSSDVCSSDLPALSLNSASCRDHPPECPGKIPQLLPEACQPGGLIDQQPIPPWRLTPRETHRSEARFYERSEEHTSELQSLMRISYAVFCLKNKKKKNNKT